MPSSARFARFFEGQSAAVLYRDFPLDLPNLGNDHYAKCKMRAVGLYDKCYLPNVVVTEDDRKRGEELLKDFHPERKMALVANTSKKFKEQREVPMDFWEHAVKMTLDEYKGECDIIQFGVSDNFTPIKGTTPMLDLSIDDLICVYYVLGDMMTVDTGDRHLMLACGGSTWVARRKSYRDHHRWTYESDKDKTLIML